MRWWSGDLVGRLLVMALWGGSLEDRLWGLVLVGEHYGVCSHTRVWCLWAPILWSITKHKCWWCMFPLFLYPLDLGLIYFLALRCVQLSGACMWCRLGCYLGVLDRRVLLSVFAVWCWLSLRRSEPLHITTSCLFETKHITQYNKTHPLNHLSNTTFAKISITQYKPNKNLVTITTKQSSHVTTIHIWLCKLFKTQILPNTLSNHT